MQTGNVEAAVARVLDLGDRIQEGVMAREVAAGPTIGPPALAKRGSAGERKEYLESTTLFLLTLMARR
jgi:hypothetical protein